MARSRDTDVLHLGEGVPDGATPLGRPIYTSSTFVFANAAAVEAYQRGETRHYLYARWGNPSVEAVEEKLAALEGAEAGLVTSSGMAAATTALFGLLSPGDEVLCGAALYGGTLHLITGALRRFGITARFLSLDELADVSRAIGPATKLVWFESPANPTLRCVDIRQVADACRARGVLSVIDNTFATPLNQQPLALGVDLVMHSATKFLNGHHDVVAGALLGPRALIGPLEGTRRVFGGILDPRPASALARGLKTLAVRIERHNANAMRLAEWLAGRDGVAAVSYPGLPSHPDHEIARGQMSGFGGMICVDLTGGYEAACRAFDRLQVFQRATSLGGTESLCSLPVLTSHYGLSDARLAEAGVTRGMLRLSVGLEGADDLVADLEQALT